MSRKKSIKKFKVLCYQDKMYQLTRYNKIYIYGSGSIGQELADALLAKGYDISALFAMITEDSSLYPLQELYVGCGQQEAMYCQSQSGKVFSRYYQKPLNYQPYLNLFECIHDGICFEEKLGDYMAINPRTTGKTKECFFPIDNNSVIFMLRQRAKMFRFSGMLRFNAIVPMGRY